MTSSSSRWLAVLWAAGAVLSATLLASDVVPSIGSLPDAVHIVGHLVVFGGLAVLLARTATPSRSLAVVAGVGLLLELGQGWAVGRLFWREAGFDMLVNGVSAVCGLYAVHRAQRPTHLLSSWSIGALAVPAVVGAHVTLWTDALLSTLVIGGFLVPSGVLAARSRPGSAWAMAALVAVFGLSSAGPQLMAPVSIAAFGGMVASGLAAVAHPVASRVAIPLLAAACVASVSPRGAVLALVVASLASLDEPASTSGAAWGVGLGLVLFAGVA